MPVSSRGQTDNNTNNTYSTHTLSWLGDRKGIRPVKKTGCWFVVGDDLTGALHNL